MGTGTQGIHKQTKYQAHRDVFSKHCWGTNLIPNPRSSKWANCFRCYRMLLADSNATSQADDRSLDEIHRQRFYKNWAVGVALVCRNVQGCNTCMLLSTCWPFIACKISAVSIKASVSTVVEHNTSMFFSAARWKQQCPKVIRTPRRYVKQQVEQLTEWQKLFETVLEDCHLCKWFSDLFLACCQTYLEMQRCTRQEFISQYGFDFQVGVLFYDSSFGNLMSVNSDATRTLLKSVVKLFHSKLWDFSTRKLWFRECD